jgi:hypothetical protein
MQENVSKIRNGFYLPKSTLIPSYQNQFMTQRQRMLNIQNGGGNNLGKKIPPQVDWTFLFNLGIFVLFICSLFYICLYRYRNKEQLRKDKELKQKQLVWEFKQALEEQNKKQAEMKKEQIMNNRMNHQMMVSSNIDNVRLNLENPYYINNNNNNTNNTNNNINTMNNITGMNGMNGMNGINYDLNFEPSFYPNFSNNYNVNYMQNKNLDLNYNQNQNQNNDSYELARKTYKLDKDNGNNMNTESTFMNQTTFKNWI